MLTRKVPDRLKGQLWRDADTLAFLGNQPGPSLAAQARAAVWLQALIDDAADPLPVVDLAGERRFVPSTVRAWARERALRSCAQTTRGRRARQPALDARPATAARPGPPDGGAAQPTR